MDEHSILENELEKIKEWEIEQLNDSFFDKIQQLPFKLLDKITPSFIHKKIESFLIN